MNRRSFLASMGGGLAVLPFVALAGRSQVARAADGPDLSGVTLTVAQNGPFWEAALNKSGVLADIPFKVKYATFPSAANAAASLLAKQTDLAIGMGALTPLLQSANADPAWTTETVPYRTVLLDKTTDPVEKPSAVTIVSAHSGIAGPADMKGKKWGYNPGSNDYAMFLFSLRKAGLSAKDVDAITINNTDGVQAIIAGDLDLWSGAGFNAIPALQRGAKVLWRGPDVGFESRIAHAARSDVLADPVRSAAAGAFIVGLAKFYLYQQAHPDEFIQVAVDVNKYTYDQAKLRSTYLSAPVPITPDVLKEQKQLADVLFDSGTLKRRIDVDLVYDDRYTKLITPLL